MQKTLVLFLAIMICLGLAACENHENSETGSEPLQLTTGAEESASLGKTEIFSSEPNRDVQPIEDSEPNILDNPASESSDINAAALSAAQISITIEGQNFYAELDDSELSREFITLLPQTISMTRVGGGREFYGPLHGSLDYDEADMQTAFENGDLAYWFSGNGLCLLYNNQVERPEIESGVIVFGKIISDLSPLYELADNVEVTVNLAE